MNKLNTLDDLRNKLHLAFTNSKPKLEVIYDLMCNYSCQEDEWVRYAFGDKIDILAATSTYTRHLVDSGNGHFNLMILIWKKGAGSSIHAHSGADCLMKVLKGKLLESRYEWPNSDNEPMTLRDETNLSEDQVAHISDEIGLHRVENPSHTELGVSLHLYWPPFSTSKVFDENTGHEEIKPMYFDTTYDNNDSGITATTLRPLELN